MSNTPQSNDTQYTLLRKILVALNSSVAGIPDSLSSILTDIQTKVTTLVTSAASIVTNTASSSTLLTSLRARLAGGVSTSTQARVTVNGNNVSVLAAASGVVYRDVQIQNLGTVPVFLRLASGADNAGANGEFALSACGVANDGSGGVYRVSGWLGVITGASTSSAAVSVTTLDLE